MRLLAGIAAAALSGLAAASSSSPAQADVYLLQANPPQSAHAPSLPKEVARHIFLQRVHSNPNPDSTTSLCLTLTMTPFSLSPGLQK